MVETIELEYDPDGHDEVITRKVEIGGEFIDVEKFVWNVDGSESPPSDE